MISADEKFVRKHWENVRSWVRDLDSYGTDQFNVTLHYDEDAAKYGGDYFQRWQEDDTKKGHCAVWSAAAEFTRNRLREATLIEMEIAWVEYAGRQGFDTMEQAMAYERVIERTKAALAELKRDMK
jgi:hypothetical protein